MPGAQPSPTRKPRSRRLDDLNARVASLAPVGYRLLPTVLAHGWHELPPFSFDERTGELEMVARVGEAVVAFRVSSADGDLRIDSDDAWDERWSDMLAQRFARILGLGQDLTGLYQALEGDGARQWVVQAGAGRLLLSASIWEDMAKTLLTTNTSWAGTRAMVARVCALGATLSETGKHAFPEPEDVAGYDDESLEARVKAGYRTAYLKQLADDVASGRLDLEALASTRLPSQEAYERLLSVRGFGPYAAGTMMRLLGRFDRISIDTSVRDVFRAQFNHGAPATDREIAAYYDRFGEIRGLVAWMDNMKVPLTANLARLAGQG